MSLHKSKLRILLTPSLLSLVSSLFLSAITMLVLGLLYQAGKGSIYDYVFGKGSSTELIASSRSSLEALNNTVFGNTILNKVLYFAFWMLIGLVVYIILYGFLRGSGAAAEDLKETSYANTRTADLLQSYAIRFSVRLAAMFGWIVFTIGFIKVILPFCALAARTAAHNFLSSNGILYALMGFAILVISFHLEVILIRLLCLRVRLFSQQEVTN